MLKVVPIPEVLPTSPLSLWCPYCGAEPGKDCRTRKGGFAILHVVRVAAAALIDTKGSEIRNQVKAAAVRTNKDRKERGR